jgi:hypothetical protein
MRWASALYRDVRGDLAYTDGVALTLFHGLRKHRQYSARYDVLKDMRFDPAADIAVRASRSPWGLESRQLGGRAEAAARLVIGVSAGWVSLSSHDL